MQENDIMHNPFGIVRDFEQALCEYTGAPYAVTTNSCTMALLLAVRYHLIERFNNNEFWESKITIPKRTYVGVPQSIIHGGGRVEFIDKEWHGYYQLKPLPVFDSARWFTKNLWLQISEQEIIENNNPIPPPFICVSFHASKTLGDTQGGAILHGNHEADAWFRRMRFDGRTEGVAPKDDNFTEIGYHCYLSPDVAARLLLKLSVLPKHNDPLPNDDYPDLSKFEVFR